MSQDPTTTPQPGPGGSSTLRRFLPLIIVGILLAAFFLTGANEYFTLRALADSRDAVKAFVEDNLLIAALGYLALYAVLVAISFPGASILTIMAGFFFGQILGGMVAWAGATVGATVIFLIVQTSLGTALAERAGGFVERLRKGFRDDALSYMFFLRLVPAFPFWVVNIVPGVLGVPLRTYVLATAVGILPGSFAYAFIGGGLDSIIVSAREDAAFQSCVAREEAGEIAPGSCSLDVNFGDFVTQELIIALVALGLVALIPVVYRRVARRKTPGTED